MPLAIAHILFDECYCLVNCSAVIAMPVAKLALPSVHQIDRIALLNFPGNPPLVGCNGVKPGCIGKPVKQPVIMFNRQSHSTAAALKTFVI